MRFKDAGGAQALLCLPYFLTRSLQSLVVMDSRWGVERPIRTRDLRIVISLPPPTTSESRNNLSRHKTQFLGYSASPITLAKVQVPTTFHGQAKPNHGPPQPLPETTARHTHPFINWAGCSQLMGYHMQVEGESGEGRGRSEAEKAAWALSVTNSPQRC